MKHALPPEFEASVEVLILGSFPGERALAAGEYYAHPLNQFWPLMSELLGEPLRALPYRARLARLWARRIGLWDVVRSCTREGSLDSRIRNARRTSFARLRTDAPRLRRVAFNGRFAARRLAEFADYETCVLPSSSPAFTQPFAEKLRAWRGVTAPFATLQAAASSST